MTRRRTALNTSSSFLAIIAAGKGGVGKTTIATLIADQAALAEHPLVPFQVDDYTRWRLMEGLDDIGLTLQHEAEITAFEATREPWRPRTLPAKHLPPVEIVAARPVLPSGDDALF